MGLLDSFGFDPDDPRKAALLQMGLELLANRGPLPQALGQAGLMGVNAYHSTKGLNDRRAEEAQQRAFRERQIAEMDQGAADRSQIRNVFAQNYMPGNLAPNDDEGNQMPPAPMRMNVEGLRQGLMGSGPAGYAAMQQFGLGPRAPHMQFAPNGQLVDTADPRNAGNNFAAPPKPEGPKPGQIREIKSGGNLHTYEFDGKEWKKIASAPQFKPEGPEKPEKAPAGYRWDGDKLAFIPGGPADPASGRKTAVPTEDERRSAGLAVRMENALQTMGKFPASGKPEVIPSAIRAATMGTTEALPNVLTSGPRQQVEAAQLDALDAALTLATGAAYTKEQLKNLSKSYFPQLGDADATVKAKEANLRKVIETARIRAGRAEGDINRVSGPNVDDLLKKYLGR